MKHKPPRMIMEDFVYSRMGMALLSAQRVEFIADALVEHLAEFSESVYGIATADFLKTTQKAKKSRKMLGQLFGLLKLNPKLVIEDVLDDYLKQRNTLIHNFWKDYLQSKSQDDIKRAIDFLYTFGQFSDRLESFFKGFLFFLILRHVKDRYHVPDTMKHWGTDFDYFIVSLDKKGLD